MIFTRIVQPALIPKEYLKQLPESMDSKRFCAFMEIALQSLTHLLYVIQDEESKIIGFLWCELNILDELLFINILSIDKLYWCNGEAIKNTTRFLQNEISSGNIKVKKVFWMTDRPALFLKLGFKKSKQVLLEYNVEA